MKIEIGSENILLERMAKTEGVDKPKAQILMYLAREGFLKFLAILYPSFMVHPSAAIYFDDIEIHSLDEWDGWLRVEMNGHACLHIEDGKQDTYVTFIKLWHSCPMPT